MIWGAQNIWFLLLKKKKKNFELWCLLAIDIRMTNWCIDGRSSYIVRIYLFEIWNNIRCSSRSLYQLNILLRIKKIRKPNANEIRVSHSIIKQLNLTVSVSSSVPICESRHDRVGKQIIVTIVEASLAVSPDCAPNVWYFTHLRTEFSQFRLVLQIRLIQNDFATV